MSRSAFAFLLIVILLLACIYRATECIGSGEGFSKDVSDDNADDIRTYGPIPVPARFSTLPPMPHPSYAVSALNPQLHPNIGVSEQGAYEASPLYG